MGCLLSQAPSQDKPEKLSWRPSGRSPLLASAFEKLWFVGSHSHPPAEVWPSKKSVASQQLREGDSFCVPCVCSSYTASAGVCSPQIPLKKISTSWRVRLFIIWKESSWSAGKSRVSFRNVFALLFWKSLLLAYRNEVSVLNLSDIFKEGVLSPFLDFSKDPTKKTTWVWKKLISFLGTSFWQLRFGDSMWPWMRCCWDD